MSASSSSSSSTEGRRNMQPAAMAKRAKSLPETEDVLAAEQEVQQLWDSFRDRDNVRVTATVSHPAVRHAQSSSSSSSAAGAHHSIRLPSWQYQPTVQELAETEVDDADLVWGNTTDFEATAWLPKPEDAIRPSRRRQANKIESTRRRTTPSSEMARKPSSLSSSAVAGAVHPVPTFEHVPDTVAAVLNLLGWSATGYPTSLQEEIDGEYNTNDIEFDEYRLAVPGIPLKSSRDVRVIKYQSAYSGELLYRVDTRRRSPIWYQKVAFDDDQHKYVLQAGVLTQEKTGLYTYYILEFFDHIVSASKLFKYAFGGGERDGSYGMRVTVNKRKQYQRVLTDYFFLCGRSRANPTSVSMFLNDCDDGDRKLFEGYVMPEVVDRLDMLGPEDLLNKEDMVYLSLLIDPDAFDSGHVDWNDCTLEHLPIHLKGFIADHGERVFGETPSESVDYSLLEDVPSALGTRMHKYLENCVNGVPDDGYAEYDPLTYRCATRLYTEVLKGLETEGQQVFMEPSFGSFRYKVCGKLDLLLNRKRQDTYLGADFKRSGSLLTELSAETVPLIEGHCDTSPFTELLTPEQQKKCLCRASGPLNWSSNLFAYAFQLGVYRKLTSLNELAVEPCWYLILVHPRLLNDGGYRIVEVDITETTFKYKGKDTRMTVEQLVNLAFAYKFHKLKEKLGGGSYE